MGIVNKVYKKTIMDFKLLLHTCNTRVIFSQFHHRYILCKFNNQTDSLPDSSPIKQFHTDWTNELTFADLIEVNMLCPSQATREMTCASLFFSYLLSLSISSVLNRLWHLHGCRVRRLKYNSTWSPVSTRSVHKPFG